jgi:predicted small lipoprotein YifL
MKLRPWLLIGVAALALGACGKRGTLERPPPLWGKDKAAHAQPVRSSEQKMQPPETRDVPIGADPLGAAPDPVGDSPVSPR